MTVRRFSGSGIGLVVVSALVIVISPAVLAAGELVNRHYRRERYPWPGERRPRRAGSVWPRLPLPGWWFPELRRRIAHRAWRGRPRPVLWAFLTNPVWIALTAPARWLIDHVRPRARGARRGGGGNGNGNGGAGVREPRRPRPGQPAGVMTLPEPGPFG